MILELGGGTNPHPKAEIVIDPVHPKQSEPRYAQQTPWDRMDLDGMTWTIDDESISHIYASHVMEHIPAGEPLLKTMNEAWRVLKRGGTFTMLMPIIGYTFPLRGDGTLVNNWRAWADPTHVSYWWLPERLHYFTGQEGADADYGINFWQPVKRRIPEEEITARLAREHGGWYDPGAWSEWGVRGGWEGYARLVKP